MEQREINRSTSADEAALLKEQLIAMLERLLEAPDLTERHRQHFEVKRGFLGIQS